VYYNPRFDAIGIATFAFPAIAMVLKLDSFRKLASNDISRYLPNHGFVSMSCLFGKLKSPFPGMWGKGFERKNYPSRVSIP